MRSATQLLLGALALAACASAGPAPAVFVLPPPVARPAPAADAKDPPPPPPDEPEPDPCAPFVEAARRELVSKIPVRDEYSPDWFERDVCVATPHGLWTMEYAGVTAVAENPTSANQAPLVTITAPWRLLHVDPSGRRVVAPGGRLEIAPFRADSVKVSAPFDYDGDGDDEVLLRTIRTGVATGRLMTARGGAVDRYAPAAAIDVDGVEDVDEDGRPDLLTFGPYRPGPSRCSSEVDPHQVVHLAAHALPDGTFSLTDAAAIAFAKQECPARPGRIAVTPFDVEPMVAVRCARLWGASATEAVKAIRATCRSQIEQCGPFVGGQCLYFDALMTWAKAKPPLRLTP